MKPIPTIEDYLIREWESQIKEKWKELRRNEGQYLSVYSPRMTSKVDASSRQTASQKAAKWTEKWFMERGVVVDAVILEDGESIGLRLTPLEKIYAKRAKLTSNEIESHDGVFEKPITTKCPIKNQDYRDNFPGIYEALVLKGESVNSSIKRLMDSGKFKGKTATAVANNFSYHKNYLKKMFLESQSGG